MAQHRGRHCAHGGQHQRPKQRRVVQHLRGGGVQNRQPPPAQQGHADGAGNPQGHQCRTQQAQPLVKALAVPVGPQAGKGGDKGYEQINHRHLQNHHRQKHVVEITQLHAAQNPLAVVAGYRGDGGVQKGVHRKRQAFQQQSLHACTAGAFEIRPAAGQRDVHHQYIGGVQRKQNGQREHQIFGEQKAQRHAQGGYDAANPEADAHDVDPLGLLEVAVPHVRPAFDQPVAGVEEDHPPLLGGIAVHKGEYKAAQPRRGKGDVTAEQIAAVGVFARKVRHLKGAHAVAGGGKTHVGNGHAGGQQAVGLRPGQCGDQQGDGRLTDVEQKAARGVEQYIAAHLAFHGRSVAPFHHEGTDLVLHCPDLGLRHIGFFHITVDALCKIRQPLVEEEHLLRGQAQGEQDVHAPQCEELEPVEMGREAFAHGLVPGRLLIHGFQQVRHANVGGGFAGVKIALDHLAGDGEGRVFVRHGGKELLIAGHIFSAGVDHRVVFVLDGGRAQDVAALARHVYLGNGGAHPDGDGVRRHDPVLHAVGEDHMEVGTLFGQFGQLGAVPLAGVAAVNQLHLRVLTQILVEPAQGFGHAYPVGGGKAGEVGARHLAQLFDLLLGHAGIAEAGNVQVQFPGGVQPELGAQVCLVFEIAGKFRPHEVHHHRAGHRAVFLLHAVGDQPVRGAAAPAGLHALFGVAVEVEPVALLLGVAEHLLPVQVHDFVQPAHVVVNMAVDGLVVVHAAGHQHLGLFPSEVLQLFAVQQLADLGGIAPPLQLQLQKKVAFVFPHRVLIEDQKIKTHFFRSFLWGLFQAVTAALSPDR